MIGVVYGIHGHAGVLKTVMADGGRRGVTSWAMIGDAVGRYADWRETLDILGGFAITLRGWREVNVTIDRDIMGSAYGSINAIYKTRADMPEATKQMIRAWPTEATVGGFHFRSAASNVVPPTDRVVVGLPGGSSPRCGFHRAGSPSSGEYHEGSFVLPMPGLNFVFPGTLLQPCNGYRPEYLIISPTRFDCIRLPPFAVADYVSNRSPMYLAM